MQLSNLSQMGNPNEDKTLEIFLKEVELLESQKQDYLNTLERLTQFVEGHWKEYPDVIAQLKEWISSSSKLKPNQEVEAIYQKFVDAVLLASEKIRFQEFIKDAPEWDREEQIKKNQKAIDFMREWQNKEIGEEEEKAIEENYENFIKILENGKL